MDCRICGRSCRFRRYTQYLAALFQRRSHILQQLLDDVLNVFAHVARFGQRGGVSDGERHIEQASQGFRQQGFTTTGGAYEQNVAFAELNIVFALFLPPKRKRL